MIKSDEGEDPREKEKLAAYDKAVDAAFRKFKDREACPDAFDEMCSWMERWLRRRGHRAVVTWYGTSDRRVAFQVNDLSRLESAEFAGKVEI